MVTLHQCCGWTLSVWSILGPWTCSFLLLLSFYPFISFSFSVLVFITYRSLCLSPSLPSSLSLCPLPPILCLSLPVKMRWVSVVGVRLWSIRWFGVGFSLQWSRVAKGVLGWFDGQKETEKERERDYCPHLCPSTRIISGSILFGSYLDQSKEIIIHLICIMFFYALEDLNVSEAGVPS